MMTCRNCIHYVVCEYSTIVDKKVKCKQYIPKTIIADTVRKIQQRLKDEEFKVSVDAYSYGYLLGEEDIDEIAEEILEENNV